MLFNQIFNLFSNATNLPIFATIGKTKNIDTETTNNRRKDS